MDKKTHVVIRQSNRQNISTETKWGLNSTAQTRMRQGLQTIMDYKRKASHAADTDVVLLDKLNTFTWFEDNSVTNVAVSSDNTQTS